MQLYYIGMDVHSKKSTFCAGSKEGKVLRTGEVPTNMSGFEWMVQLIKEAAGQEEVKLVAGMESGNEAFQTVMMLRKLDVEAHVYHAKEVRDKATKKRQKNDREDAKALYTGLRLGFYQQEVWVPSEQELLVKWLGMRIKSYVGDKTRAINRAKAALRKWRLQDFSNKKLETDVAWKKLIKRIEGMSKEKWSDMVIWDMDKKDFVVSELKRCYELWHKTDKDIERLTAELEEAVKKLHPDQQKGIQRVDDMFGVGFVSAVILVLAIGDPSRFKNSRQVKKYFGFAPTENSSGGKTRTGGMDRMGNKAVRALAIELAQQAMREKHPLSPLYYHIFYKKGKRQIANSVIAAKLLQIIWRMLRDNEAFDPKKLNIEYVVLRFHDKNGMLRFKAVAQKKRNLKRFLLEHNLSEEYVIDVLDQKLIEEQMAALEKAGI